MSDETTYETQRIDHLGIVTGISREIELVETIDRKVGQMGRKVSCGEGVLSMIPNALGFSSRALYLMPDYMKNKPVDLLIKPGLAPEDFNDDSLGRCLITQGFFCNFSGNLQEWKRTEKRLWISGQQKALPTYPQHYDD